MSLADVVGPEISKAQVAEHVIGVVQQFSLKAGMAKFGACAAEAVTKELKQLQDMETYIPIDPNKMTR